MKYLFNDQKPHSFALSLSLSPNTLEDMVPWRIWSSEHWQHHFCGEKMGIRGGQFGNLKEGEASLGWREGCWVLFPLCSWLSWWSPAHIPQSRNKVQEEGGKIWKTRSCKEPAQLWQSQRLIDVCSPTTLFIHRHRWMAWDRVGKRWPLPK